MKSGNAGVDRWEKQGIIITDDTVTYRKETGMKKFDRLPPEQRKEEIQMAALALFHRKGFSRTTMENIVGQVSLSKGGVYRIYGSTTEILKDLILKGMRLRNAYYGQQAQKHLEAGEKLSLPMLVEIITDSLILYPEYAGIYVEFLWEKRRNPELELLYEQICRTSVEETGALIRKVGADDLLMLEPGRLQQMTNLMNGAVLSVYTLHLEQQYQQQKKKITEAILCMLKD